MRGGHAAPQGGGKLDVFNFRRPVWQRIWDVHGSNLEKQISRRQWLGFGFIIHRTCTALHVNGHVMVSSVKLCAGLYTRLVESPNSVEPSLPFPENKDWGGCESQAAEFGSDAVRSLSPKFWSPLAAGWVWEWLRDGAEGCETFQAEKLVKRW